MKKRKLILIGFAIFILSVPILCFGNVENYKLVHHTEYILLIDIIEEGQYYYLLILM